MIHELSSGTKHGLDVAAVFGAFGAVGLTLANAAMFMSLLAASCSVIWFAIRVHDRVKYGPGK